MAGIRAPSSILSRARDAGHRSGWPRTSRDDWEPSLRPGRGRRPGPQARGAGKGAWRAGLASRPRGLAPPEASGPPLLHVGLPERPTRRKGLGWRSRRGSGASRPGGGRSRGCREEPGREPDAIEGGPAGSPGRMRPDSRSLRRSPFGSRAPSTSRPPAARRQQASDGASPTFVRQVRHFTSLSPPTRPRARPPGSACFLRRLPAPAHSTSRRRGEEEGSSHRLALRSRACVLTVPRPPPLPARRRGGASAARMRAGSVSRLAVLRSWRWQDAKGRGVSGLRARLRC